MLLITSAETSLVLDLSNRSEVAPPITGLPQLINSNGYDGHAAAVTLGGGLVYVPFGGDTGPGYRIYDYTNGTVITRGDRFWLIAEMSPDGQYVAEVPLLDAEATTPDGEQAPLYGTASPRRCSHRGRGSRIRINLPVLRNTKLAEPNGPARIMRRRSAARAALRRRVLSRWITSWRRHPHRDTACVRFIDRHRCVACRCRTGFVA